MGWVLCINFDLCTVRAFAPRKKLLRGVEFVAGQVAAYRAGGKDRRRQPPQNVGGTVPASPTMNDDESLASRGKRGKDFS